MKERIRFYFQQYKYKKLCDDFQKYFVEDLKVSFTDRQTGQVNRFINNPDDKNSVIRSDISRPQETGHRSRYGPLTTFTCKNPEPGLDGLLFETSTEFNVDIQRRHTHTVSDPQGTSLSHTPQRDNLLLSTSLTQSSSYFSRMVCLSTPFHLFKVLVGLCSKPSLPFTIKSLRDPLLGPLSLSTRQYLLNLVTIFR